MSVFGGGGCSGVCLGYVRACLGYMGGLWL